MNMNTWFLFAVFICGSNFFMFTLGYILVENKYRLSKRKKKQIEEIAKIVDDLNSPG